MTAFAVLALAIGNGCPALTPIPGAPGLSAPTRAFAAEAITLNTVGKTLYRQGRFEEARRKYRAALAVDPDFHAPALNVACSLAREERFAEAAREAAALIRRSYVPWAREVMEATDLAVLHARPEMREIEQARAGAQAAWGQEVKAGLLFLARARPSVRSSGEGVFVLGLHQEIFAWLPSTARFRQVTAEDGRVLAFVRSADQRKVVYVRGSKLVRTSGEKSFFRGADLRLLDVPSMSLGPAVSLDGDLSVIELGFATVTAATVRVLRNGGDGESFDFDGATLRRKPTAATAAIFSVRLTGDGVVRASQVTVGGGCPFRAKDDFRSSSDPRIRVRSTRGDLLLDTSYGAGLFGLPFPL